jgi:hypothetical protein
MRLENSEAMDKASLSFIDKNFGIETAYPSSASDFCESSDAWMIYQGFHIYSLSSADKRLRCLCIGLLVSAVS